MVLIDTQDLFHAEVSKSDAENSAKKRPQKVTPKAVNINPPGSRPPRRRALGIYEKALGPDHPDVAITLNNLALLLKVRGSTT